MPRRQLPKAYLRLDPNIDAHPDPATMLVLIVWANRQPHRGRFRTLATLRKIIRPKALEGALARGDLVELPRARINEEPPTWYVAGWDEWQEGDLTVGERVRRVRERRSNPGADLDPLARYMAVTETLPTPKALGRKDVRADPPTPPADAGGPSPQCATVTGTETNGPLTGVLAGRLEALLCRYDELVADDGTDTTAGKA